MDVVAAIVRELTVFAAVGILVGGIDDLIVDLIWAGRTVWRRLTVYRRFARADATTLRADGGLTIAVFVPAWREAEVIGPMLRAALARWGEGNYRIFVGCYPNDPATVAEVEAIGSDRVRLAINPRPGGTTKGDNLNSLWRAMLADEAATGNRYAGIALHDCEDVVHPAEIGIYQALLARFDLVQLPVLPLIETSCGLWRRVISSVAADEFSEAHQKTLVVREAVGAAVPSAGVGCCFSRVILDRVAARQGVPFDTFSLTEDYELGLRIAELGGRGIFVRLPAAGGQAAVAVREHFPETFAAAVTQKARWQAGIALSGWHRLGWRGGLAERWMRLRDRRSIVAALVLSCGYGSALAVLILSAAGTSIRFAAWEVSLFAWCTGLMLWRMLVRALFVARDYGWAEGLASAPRLLIGNAIAIAAARRALFTYARERRGRGVSWDKTEHRFPELG